MAIDSKKYYRNKGNKKFSQRYNRTRFNDPEFEIRGKKIYFEEIDTDEYWNPYRFRYETRADYYFNGYDVAERYEQEYYDDKLSYLFFNKLIDILNAKLNSPFSIFKSATSSLIENNKQRLAKKGRTKESIEESLFEYKKRFSEANINDDVDEIVNEILNSITKFNAEEYVVQEANNNSATIKKLVLFAPFWIRSPLSWKKNKNYTLFEHVFGIYEAPSFLKSSINYKQRYDCISSQIETLSLYWYILVSQGGSLKKMSTLTSIPFNKKSIKFLYKVPDNMSFDEGVFYAEILSKDGEMRHFNILARFNNDSSTIDWIIKNCNELTDQECNLILNWAEHERVDANRQKLKPFSWKGRTPKSTLERAEAYHQTIIESVKRDFNWEKSNYDWKYTDGYDNDWEFIELISSKELRIEGALMNHCVASYDYKCAHGNSIIVSLRKEGEHRLTIELDTNGNRIIQARGESNKFPTMEEEKVLSKWVNNKGLRIGLLSNLRINM